MTRSRYLFSCGCGLLPLAVVVAFWIRSYLYHDSLVLYGPNAEVQSAASISGTVQLVLTNTPVGKGWAWSFDCISHSANLAGKEPVLEMNPTIVFGFNPENTKPHVFGSSTSFAVARYVRDEPSPEARQDAVRSQQFQIQMPYWALAILGGLFAVRGIHAKVIVRRRELKGLCAACGYDLRCSSDRCPECGLAI